MIKNKRIQYFFVALLFLVISASVAAAIGFSKNNADTATKHKNVTLEIIKTLDKRHFKERSVDDALSGEFLDNYLSQLDPSKAYFLASDINEFEQYRTTLDDLLLKGDNSPGYLIYSRFRQRFEERMTNVVAVLKDDKYVFDFTREETFNNDPDSSNWLTSKEDADDFWRKRTKAFLLTQKLSGEEVQKSKEQLLKRYENQLTRIAKNSEDDVYEIYINAFTELYDPHTSYLSPRSAENFNINMSLSLEGIGAVLSTDEENTKVVRLVAGGPADKQGELKPADLITGVGQDDGEILDVVGWRLDEVVDKIRGPKGSVVKLQIQSDSPTDKVKTIAIKRDKVKLEDQAAQKAILDVEYNNSVLRFGVIEIPNFYLDFQAYRERDPNYRSTTRDVRRLIAELAQNNTDGLIIDLRNNGGGSLQEARTLTELFLDKGPVVQIGNGVENQVDFSTNAPYYHGPLLVLINRLSASASEIFAGAIQDYDRGIIVGSQSFGKGTVQSLTPLKSRGDLKLTESKFYRVSGESTQHRGVLPDVIFPESVDTERVGESSYDTALAWSTTKAVPHQKYLPIDTLLKNLNEQHQKRAASNPEFIYILEQKQLFDQYSSPKQVSLNEKNRIIEQENFEAEALLIENKRRKAKGSSIFANYEALKASNEKEQEERQALSGATVIDVENDVILKEAGYVFGDFISSLSSHYQRESTASR